MHIEWQEQVLLRDYKDNSVKWLLCDTNEKSSALSFIKVQKVTVEKIPPLPDMKGILIIGA